MSTVEDVTTILDKGMGVIEPKICFDPAQKTLKKGIQTLNVTKGMVDSFIEANTANYLEERITAFQSPTMTKDVAIEASRTLPVQLISPWGNKSPGFSTYSDPDFVDNYEVFEEISQKATKRRGW